MGLLPVLLLFILPLLSSLFSGETAVPSAPTMVFDHPHPPLYTLERTIPAFGTKYYVNPADVNNYTPAKLHKLDKTAQVIFVRQLNNACEEEMAHKRRLEEAAQGFWYTDQEKMAVAKAYDMKMCRRLQTLPRG